jgi:hypothetical protein
MNKDADKSISGGLLGMFLSERHKIRNLEFTTNSVATFAIVSFLQNIHSIMYVTENQTLWSIQKFFSAISVSSFFKLTGFEYPSVFLMVFFTFMLMFPFLFFCGLITDKYRFSKFHPPKLYELITHNNKALAYLSSIFVFTLLLPLIEMSALVSLCPAYILTPSNNDKYFFANLNFSLCSNSLMILVRLFALISLFANAILLFVLINFILPRHRCSSNALSNESKRVDILIVINKCIFGIFILAEALNSSTLKYIIGILCIISNCWLLWIMLRRCSFFSQKISRLVSILTMTEILFSFFILLQSLLLEFGAIELIDQVYIGLFLIVSFMCAQASIDKMIAANIKPASAMNSVDLYTKKCFSMYYLLQEASDATQITPKLFQDTHIDEILSYFRIHFLKCQATNCVCYKIKRNEVIIDCSSMKEIDYSDERKSLDGVICITSRIFFYKFFILERLKELHLLHPDDNDVLFAVTKFQIFEMKDFLRGCEGISSLEFKDLSWSQRYELLYLKLFIFEHYRFDYNHRVQQKDYINIEKFVELQNSIIEIELSIFNTMTSFYKFILNLVE